MGLFDQDVRERIPVEHSETGRDEYWRTYVYAFRAILCEYGKSYLSDLSHTDRLPSIPSWCLNLNAKFVTMTLPEGLPGAGISTAEHTGSILEFAYDGLAYLKAF